MFQGLKIPFEKASYNVTSVLQGGYFDIITL